LREAAFFAIEPQLVFSKALEDLLERPEVFFFVLAKQEQIVQIDYNSGLAQQRSEYRTE